MTDQLTALLEESRQLGFLGPGPVGPQLDHGAAFAVAVTEPPARALDLGAGGGLPGLVLATRFWPAARWTYLDARARRTEFLEQAVADLGEAERIDVITGRAEVLGRDPEHRGAYDLVVSRSFGSPGVTAECAAPFLRVGGTLVVSEPPAAALEDRWNPSGLGMVGFGAPEPIVVDGDHPVHLVRLTLLRECPSRFPRRDGMPTKRPLF